MAVRASTESPRLSYRPLSTVSNWWEYYIEISDKKSVLGSFVKPAFTLDTLVVQSSEKEETMAKMINIHIYMLAGTESLSMALTTLAALEDSMSDLSDRKRISIHLVRARGAETEQSWVFEELLHLYHLFKLYQ